MKSFDRMSYEEVTELLRTNLLYTPKRELMLSKQQLSIKSGMKV